jgi:hypothetical protein
VLLVFAIACVGLQSVPSDLAPGTATSSAPGAMRVGDLELDPTSLHFGEIAVASEGRLGLTLHNVGEAGIHVAAALEGDAFALSATGAELDGGGTTVLDVIFAPRFEGPTTGSLVLTVPTGETASVALDGVGIAAETAAASIKLEPAILDFGTLDVYDALQKTVTVRNTGAADLLVSNVQADDAAFTITGDFNAPKTLGPGEVGDIDVTFTPPTAKTYSNTLTITSDDSASPRATVRLRGTAADRCDICAPILSVESGASDPHSITDFNATFGPDTKTITLNNDGDQPLEVSNVVINNDSLSPCGTFSLGGWRGATTVAAYGSTDFTITYSASGDCWDVPQEGFDANVCHILSNDPAEPDWVIALGGTRIEF